MLRYRITQQGFKAFLQTAVAQHQHLHKSWLEAIKVAWLYGPIS